jgi:urease accessory protein UreF
MLLVRLGTTIVTAVERTFAQEIDAMTSFAPGQELAGIRHRDVLTTRLYIS